MKRITDWIAKRLVVALAPELRALWTAQAKHNERHEERFARIEARLHKMSTILDAMPRATRHHVEKRLAGLQRVVESQLGSSRAKLESSIAKLESSIAKAEESRREETPGHVRAELAGVLDQVAQDISWSKDTARMVAELRAEVRLLTQAPDAPTSAEHGEAGDPRLLRRYLEQSNIREIYPSELFEKITGLSLPIASINEKSGHGNQIDLMYVAAIAKVREARSIFEFGTFIGRTTYHLTFASKDAHVTTLNLRPADDVERKNLGRMFRGSDREMRITQLLGDSAEFDPAPYAGRMDFIFVDADHSYELVKNDTEKALVMLKPGGAIVWHDYAVKSPGVVRYIQEFAEERPVFRLKHTCLIVYLDGVDALAFQPNQRASATVPQQVLSARHDQAERRRVSG